MGTAAFSQWECQVVLYRADENGLAAEVEWLGGCENRMQITQGFEDERADRSGDRYTQVQNLEEAHTIELENLWLTRYESGGALASPRLHRNQKFVAVLLWEDEETLIWHKRTYYGVQIGPLTIASENEYFTQKVPMRAGYYIPLNGRRPAEQATIAPTVGGIVRYVTAAGFEDLLLYEYDSRLYLPLGDAAGKIAMPGANGTYPFRLFVGGVLALGVDNDGALRVNALVATGGTFTAGYPRAEFYNGVSRIASLSADGVLAVANFTETATDPAALEDFDLLAADGSWLASLATFGLAAPAVVEGLP